MFRISISSLLLVLTAGPVLGQVCQVTDDGSSTFSCSLAPLPDQPFEPAANGKWRNNVFVTTTDDMMVVDFSIEVISGSLYHAPLSSTNTYWDRMDCSLIIPCPLDSWATLPGPRADPGLGSSDSPLSATFVDMTYDGPQNNFHMLHIAMTPDENGEYEFRLIGNMQTAGQPTPNFTTFEAVFSVPEPGSASLCIVALLGGLSIVRRRGIVNPVANTNPLFGSGAAWNKNVSKVNGNDEA